MSVDTSGHRSMRANRFEIGWIDFVIGSLAAAGVVWYLSSLPHDLNPSDEAVHLYEAKRLLAGEVMYRDVFEIITPGWMYLMALLFHTFGTDMATARISMAVIHAATMLMTVLICLRLGVRRELAWTAGFAYVVVCQAAWPIASQHWLSTFLCVLLFLVLVQYDGRNRFTLLAAGVVLGLLIGVQQQRGAIMAGGLAAWVVADGLLAGWLGDTQERRSVWRPLAALVVGAVVVVAPMLIGLIAAAGFEPVWRALVVHPLTNYVATNHCPWGHMDALTAPQGKLTFPRVLKYLPLVFVVLAPRLVGRVRAGDREMVRRLLLVVFFCLVSVASIAYYPDFIHIAFIAPVFFVAIAECLEWALTRSLASAKLRQVAATVVAAALVAIFARQLRQNFVRLWEANPITRQTSFGRIDLPMETLGRLYDRVDALLQDVPLRQFFCYPTYHSLYLMADAQNPTRYGFFFANYNSPDQVQEVLDVLQAKRLPYIVLLAVPGLLKPDDPIVGYLEREYEPLGEGPVDRVIFGRKQLG